MASAIVAGEIAPQDAVERVHRELLCPFDHPAGFGVWCTLWEGLDPVGHSSVTGTALDEAIRRTAGEWT